MAIVRDLSLSGGGYLDAHIATPGGGSTDMTATNAKLDTMITSLGVLHTDLQSLINGTATINVADDINTVFIGSVAYTVVRAPLAAAASADILVAQGAGKKIYVLDYEFISAGAGTVKFQSNAATDLTGAMPVAANGGLMDNGKKATFATGANEKLNVVLTGAATLQGRYAYIVV